MQIPTVKITHADGFCIINQSDFNADIHQLFKEKQSLNINTATKEELIALDGIGKKTADEIISSRPFESVEDAIAQFKILESVDLEV